MSLNSNGFSYKFGGEDAGLEKASKNAVQGFDAVTSGVEKLVAVSAGFILSKTLQMPQIGQFANTVIGLASDIHVTSTAIEANYVAASKVTSKALAGMGLTNKELAAAKSEVAGIALEMNVSADGLAKNMAILKKAGVDVKQLGFKSFSEYSKFAEVADVDTARLASSTVFLGKTFKMTQAEVGDLINRGYSIGKAFGLGKESINTMSSAVEILSTEASSLLSTMSPNDAKKFILGVEGVSAAYLKMGASAADANALSIELGKGLTKEKVGFNKMITGIQQDLPEMTDVLAQGFGNVETAFDLIKNDPLKFTSLMSKSYAAASKKGGDALMRFNLQASEAFGPKFLTLIQNGADSLEKVKTVSDDLASGKTKVSMASEIAKGFEDGRTMAERFALEKEKLYQKLKDINTNGIVSDADFVKSYSKSTNIMVKKITQLAGDKGIVGKATSVMMNFANHGIGGVLASLTPMGPALATIIEKFGPILMAMPAIAKSVGLLFSPITLVVGAIAGLYFYMKEAAAGGGKFKSMVDGAWASIKGFASDAYVAIKDFIHSIPWDKVGETIKTGLVMAFDGLVSIAVPLANAIKNWFVSVDWGSVATTLVDYLGKAIVAIAWVTTMLIDAISKINWGAVGAKAVDLGLTLVKWILMGAAVLALKIPTIIIMALKVMGGVFTGLWDAMVGSPWLAAIGVTLGAIALLMSGPAIAGALSGLVHKVTVWKWLIIGEFEHAKLNIGKSITGITSFIKNIGPSLGIIGVAVAGLIALESLVGSTGDKLEAAAKKIEKEAEDEAHFAAQRMLKLRQDFAGALKQFDAIVMADKAARIQQDISLQTKLLNETIRINSRLKQVQDEMLIDWLRHNKSVADAEIALSKQTAKAVKMFEDQKVAGVSPEAANQSFETIAGMSPEQFHKDLITIKSDYSWFLGNVVKDTSGLLAKTKVSFTQYVDENKKIWPGLDVIVQQFQSSSTTAINTYWANAIKQTGANINVLVSMAAGLHSQMAGMLSKTNLLDAVTTDQQIMSWAVRIVSGLTVALIGANNPFTAAIAQASGLAAALRANPEALTMNPKDIGGSLAAAQGSDMLTKLNSSINNPDWVKYVVEAIYASNGKKAPEGAAGPASSGGPSTGHDLTNPKG
jgi:hypothetical protein